MKLIINKKYLAPFLLIVFSVLLFGLANNAFALTETETVQYRLDEDQGSGGSTVVDDGTTTTPGTGGGTSVDDGTTTTPGAGGGTSGGDISYTDGSATFYFTYNGPENLHPGYRPIDCYSVDPSGLRCDIDLGFESNITPMSCDNVWDNKRTDVVVNPDEDGNVYINWGADLCDYNMPYEITGSGSVAIVGGSSTITSSSDLYCKGGMPSETNCSPSTGWETSSCPASYFCPGYGQGVSGDSNYDEGATQAVTFSRAVIKDPKVDVVGVDIKDNNKEYGKDKEGGEMTVQSAQNGKDTNVQIKWYTTDISSPTVCTCNDGSADCGSGISTSEGEAVLASGDGGNGNYALTGNTTFTVTCE